MRLRIAGRIVSVYIVSSIYGADWIVYYNAGGDLSNKIIPAEK